MSMLIEGISVVLRSCRNDHVLAAYALEEEDSGGYVFFFSSRRRHTILQCDWSSDVCSSDLKLRAMMPWIKEKALVHQGLFLDPGHHGAQLGADLLDLVGVVEAAGGLEVRLAGLALADPFR